MIDRTEKSPVWKFVKMMFLPLIVAVFMLIWLRSEITSLEYRISGHEAKRMDLLKKKKELIVSRSDLLSIKNIEQVAMEKFGLTFPDRRKVISVKRGDRPFNYKAGFGSHSD